MSDRTMHAPFTQGVNHRWLPVKVLCNGTGVPTLGEGDPNGSYFTIARTSAGAFTLKTKDPYVALVSFQATVQAATQGNWTSSRGAATKNADNTFSIPFTIYLAGTATDLNAGTGAGTGSVDVMLVMRNSNVVP
jgi:hypothetical protein